MRDERLAHGTLQGVVGDENEGSGRGLRLRRPLHDALDGDLHLGQPVGDVGHGSRPVVQLEGHVIAALVGLELGFPVGLKTRGRHAEGGYPVAAGDVADVRQDARGRRMRARAPPLEHDIADEVALDGDRVVDAVDIGNRGALADQGRMHPLLDAVVGLHRHAQELDPVAEIIGVADVGRG